VSFSTWLYRYRVQVRRESVTRNSDGVVTAVSWPVVTESLACYKEPLSSTLAATLAGRLESDNLFSLDLFHVAEDADVQAGDYFEMLASEDGTETAEFGNFWVIRGQARAYASLGVLQMGRKVFMASKQQFGPDGAN